MNLQLAAASAQLPNNLLASLKSVDPAAPSPLLGGGSSVGGRGGSVLGPSASKQSNRGGGGDSEQSSEYHTLNLFSHLRYTHPCFVPQTQPVLSSLNIGTPTFT